MKKYLITTIGRASTLAAILVMPASAFAAEQSLRCVVQSFVGLINSVVPLLFAVAVVVFIWGIIKTLAKADRPDARAQGRSLMIYGVIAIAVMLGVWGLAYMLKNSFFPGVAVPFEDFGSSYQADAC